MPAGRPRKYENDAARQAAYRERKQPNAPMTAREMRRALADIHAWGKALCADGPSNEAHQFAAAVVGPTPKRPPSTLPRRSARLFTRASRATTG